MNLITSYINYCKKILIFPISFFANPKISLPVKVVVIIAFAGFLYIVNKNSDKVSKNKMANYREIKVSNLSFVKGEFDQSWSDIKSSMEGKSNDSYSTAKMLNMKVGEKVSLVVYAGPISKEVIDGKSTVSSWETTSNINFDFVFTRPNCWSQPRRNGSFIISLDIPFEPKYQNKFLAVKGEISDLWSKTPSDACGDASCTVSLKDVEIEEFNGK
jgi:hypothetical protein